MLVYGERDSQHAGDHLLVLVACGGVVEGAGEGYDLWVFLLGGHVFVLFSRTCDTCQAIR